MKGLYKGVKYTLSQIFVVKEEEPELEIGGPTDVKHVGHIGWDGPSGGAPSWMGQYKTGPDFASTSIGATGTGLSTWSSSQDYGESKRTQKPASATCRDIPESELAPAKRKPRRKKCKTNSCPPSSSGSTRSSRAAKPKVKFVEDNAESSNIEVA